MNESLSALVLSRPELVYSLKSFRHFRIVGVELEELEWPEERIAPLLRSAEENLIQRNLLSLAPDGARQLDSVLVGLVGALTLRQIALIVAVAVRGYGKQISVFNLYEDALVEHSPQPDGTHRLAPLWTPEMLFARLRDLVPLQPVVRQGRPELTLRQSEFQALRQMTEEGAYSTAIAWLSAAGLSAELAPLVVQALGVPEVSVSLACLVCAGAEVTAASSATIFADRQSAWGLWPGTVQNDELNMILTPSGINDVQSAVAQWLELQET